MTVKRIRLEQAPDSIKAREPFRASEMWGVVVRWQSEIDVGRLEGDDLERFQTDVNAAHEVGGQTYVVLSFHTPIAWTTPDGQLYVPDTHYSSRTTRHQNIVRRMSGVTTPK